MAYKTPVQRSPISKTKIVNSSLDVVIQDATSPLVAIPFHRVVTDGNLTLAIATVMDTSAEGASTYNITVDDSDPVTVGDLVEITDAIAGNIYYGNVIAKPLETVLTLDTPLNAVYPVGSPVIASSTNMAVNGSVTRQIFEVHGALDFEIDINRIVLSMLHNGAGTDALFGDQPAITKGVVIRRKDGVIQPIANFKSNQDFRLLSFDLMYITRNAPQNDFSTAARMTFNGQEKYGSVIRVGANEQLECIIQDDLSALTDFRIYAHGSYVTP